MSRSQWDLICWVSDSFTMVNLSTLEGTLSATSVCDNVIPALNACHAGSLSKPLPSQTLLLSFFGGRTFEFSPPFLYLHYHTSYACFCLDVSISFCFFLYSHLLLGSLPYRKSLGFGRKTCVPTQTTERSSAASTGWPGCSDEAQPENS